MHRILFCVENEINASPCRNSGELKREVVNLISMATQVPAVYTKHFFIHQTPEQWQLSIGSM